MIFYFLIISLWFDNLSYLIQEQIQLIQTPIIIHINHSMALKFVMTEQYKIYLISITTNRIEINFETIILSENLLIFLEFISLLQKTNISISC